MSEAFDSSSRVNDSDLVAWPRVAAISAMVAFSLPTFITGIEVYANGSINHVLLSLVIASVLLTLIGGLMGVIGAKTRMSSYLLVKIAFGEKGAAAVNIAFAISLVGWFGVNIDLFANAVQSLGKDLLNVTIPTMLIEVMAGLLMVTTTVFGFRAINILASILTPIIALVTFVLLFGSLDEYSVTDFLNEDKASVLNLSQLVGAITGAIIVGAIILPDITRFCRHYSGGFYTAFCAFMLVQLFVLVVAAFASAAFNSTDILELMLKAGLGITAFFIVIAGSWVLNSLNLYSAMLSVGATVPKASGKIPTLLVGLLGVVAAFFNILDAFITFLIVLVTLFIPVCGIIITDYFIVNKARYTFDILENNKAISVPGCAAWFIGALYATLTELGVISSISPVASIDAILLSAVFYIALSKWID